MRFSLAHLLLGQIRNGWLQGSPRRTSGNCPVEPILFRLHATHYQFAAIHELLPEVFPEQIQKQDNTLSIYHLIPFRAVTPDFGSTLKCRHQSAAFRFARNAHAGFTLCITRAEWSDFTRRTYIVRCN